MKINEFAGKFIDRTVDLMFSKDKAIKFLLIITILGLILRITGAINIGVAADDMVRAPHAVNIIHGGLLSIVDNPPLWYYFTDISYKIFGVNQFGSRFADVLFGTLMIVLVYMLSRKFLNKKGSLIAAFFISISPFFMKNVIAEMDTMMTFFIFLSIYLFILFMEKEKKSYLIWSAITMGLAITTKYIAVIMLVSHLLYFIYNSKKTGKRIFTKKNVKYAVLFCLIIFAFCLPFLINNYLLYKEKGYLDFQFAKFLGTSKDIYSGLSGIDEGYAIKKDSIDPFFHLWNQGDKIIFILGLIGLIFLFKKDKKLLNFIVIYLLPTFLFMIGSSTLSKHYLFMIPLFSMSSAFVLDSIFKIFENRKNARKIECIILILVFLTTLCFYGSDFYFKSGLAKIMDYKSKNIQENSLVVVDGRFYRGQTAWMFNDRAYLEASYFQQLMQVQENITGKKVQTKVYFIECAKDDCGWGTIGNQPDFNKSMEDMASLFRNNSNGAFSIQEHNINKAFFIPLTSPASEDYANVYSVEVTLNEHAPELAYSTHTWYFNPVGYKDMSNFMFNYEVSGFNKFLKDMAYFVLWIEIILALLSAFILLYLFTEENEEVVHNNPII